MTTETITKTTQTKASRTVDMLLTGHMKTASQNLNSHGRITKARRISNRAERRVAKRFLDQ